MEGAAAIWRSQIARVPGTVVALAPGRATVRVESGFSCPRCAAGRGCGAVFLAADRTRLVDVSVPSRLVLVVGQPVDLTLPPARLLEAAWVAYGIPLLALLGGTLAAATLMPAPVSDVAGLGAAAAGLVAAGGWARRRWRAAGCPGRFVPSLEATVRGSAPREGR